MDIQELNIAPREQRTLESMGFTTLERIALCYRDELGLGKGKGDAIIQRARSILFNHNVKKIEWTEQQITIALSDVSKPTLVSVEDVLGIYGDLKRQLDGDRLVVFRPERKPCFKCGTDPVYLCRVCGAGLCEKCRYDHEHGYSQSVDIRSLDSTFNQALEKARVFIPIPAEKRAGVEAGLDEEVTRIAAEQGFTGFARTFFSELEGNDLMKKALSCALFSTPEEPVHVLIVGDPAGGKTLARDIITRRLGPEIELVGANSTRSGLVCNLATGEAGVLTYSSGKIVLVDEFDKIPDQDVEYCLELLSNGKCSVHSARIHETIESHFIMIAFANPVHTVFTSEPMAEIGLSPLLLSRFALIVKAEGLEADRRKALLKRKFLGEVASSENARRHLLWLREARKHHPKITASEDEIERYIGKVDKLVEEYLKAPLRRDLRMGDYAKRVPAAMARASFSDVDGKILTEAIQLMEECIAAW